jgi:hypothetical protein
MTHCHHLLLLLKHKEEGDNNLLSLPSSPQQNHRRRQQKHALHGQTGAQRQGDFKDDSNIELERWWKQKSMSTLSQVRNRNERVVDWIGYLKGKPLIQNGGTEQLQLCSMCGNHFLLVKLR